MVSHRRTCVGLLLLNLVSSPAIAGGFYLQEQSPREIGRAFSGGAAAADDPSTIFFNPAGMTELEGVQISTGGTLLFITAKQSNQGSTRTDTVPSPPLGVPGSFQTTIPGGDGGKAFDSAIPVPAFYASAHIGDSPLWLGLGVSAPFGLKLEYAPDFFGRYDSLHSELQTFNIQPSAALRVSDAISVGGGIDVQYVDVKLTNALPNRASPFALLPPDGSYQVSGDDLSVGWNLGILAKTDNAQLGLHYRSRMKHRIKGDRTISGLRDLLAGFNGTQEVTAPLTLPDIVTASVAYKVNPRTRLMATGRFYNWSVFKQIAIISDAGRAIKQLDYKDSWSISIGGEHDLSDRLTLRAGAMFDKTPTNEDFLTTRVPDGDRTWASLGATYDLSNRLSLNLSYAHVFISKQMMDRTDSFYGGPAGQVDIRTLTGNSGNVDMLATSLTARF